MARGLVGASILVALAVVAGLAQGDVDSVRMRVEKRFALLPIANGVVLTPRFKTDVRSIEVADSAISIDGTPVSGGELKQRLGADADLVLQVSYLDPAVRRTLANAPAATPPPAPPGTSGTTLELPPIPDQPLRRTRRRDDVVRIGGSVSIDSDESVEGDVVVIGGHANVNGQVDGELVVVGGSATLGPEADIGRDVTVVGGGLSRDPGAVIRGKVQDVGFGGVPWRRGEWSRWGDWDWNPMDGLYPIAKFMGTLMRMGLLMLLAGLVILVARTPVEQISERAMAEPGKSWITGFLIEILFVPVLVMTIFVLLISIIGIPLLILVPFAIVAAMVVFLLGFTGVAFALGKVLQARAEQLRGRPYLATFVGITTILTPLLLARLINLTGGFVDGLGFIVGLLLLVGFVSEYMAWTFGLGAAVLAWFGRSRPVTSVPAIPSPTVST
jgi:hypothetical protein